jgi:hypothetical protein
MPPATLRSGPRSVPNVGDLPKMPFRPAGTVTTTVRVGRRFHVWSHTSGVTRPSVRKRTDVPARPWHDGRRQGALAGACPQWRHRPRYARRVHTGDAAVGGVRPLITTQAVGAPAHPPGEGVAARVTVMRRQRRQRRMLVWIGWLMSVLAAFWLALLVAGFA